MFGIIGVLLASCLAKTLTFVWYDPYIVYKHVLKSGLALYAKKYLFHWGFLFVLTFVCSKVYDIVNMDGILGFVLGVAYITIIVNGSFFLVYFRSKNFKYIMSMLKSFLNRRSAKQKK